MTYYKALVLILSSIIVVSCGSNSDVKNSNFSLGTNNRANKFQLGDTLRVKLQNKKNKEIESVEYSLNGEPISETYVLNVEKLGIQKLDAKINTSDGPENLQLNIIVNNDEQPKIYGYTIVNEYPHDITSYTQGLEFHNGVLYESTGQYNESKLRKINFENGEVLKNIDLDGRYFGEGLTILNNELYQLTWKSNIGFVYNLETFEKIKTFNYGQSKEGWGLCNNGNQIFKSDGTEDIFLLNPENLAELDKIEVYTNNGKIASLNELEWIEGKIYANIYQRNGVVIINPNSGAVEGVIDFSKLKNKVTQHPGLDVLNGIAYNPERNTIFVTGKRWDKLFEVQIFEQ